MNLIIIIIGLLIFGLYMALKLKHDLHMLQQNSYINQRYLRWSRLNSRPPLSDLLCFGLMLIAFILAIRGRTDLVIYAYLLLSLIAIARIIYLKKRPPAKKPLVMTARAKRLYFSALGLWLILTVGCALIYQPLNNPFYHYLALLGLWAIIAYSGHYLLLINILLKPIEQSINHKYLNQAKQILAARPDLIKIAITGSYGKTSVKMILAAMLAEQFITLATPESVNTPMGITRIVREKLKPIHQIFICEMGAKQVGDIAELCDLVQPKAAILTAIGAQHLETFGSQQNIINTKFELIRALPADGLAVLNLANQYIFDNQEQAPCPIIGYGLDAAQAYFAQNISYQAQGLSFDIIAPNGESATFNSRLLGNHNINNIVGAAALAHQLGLPLAKAALAVRSLAPLEHRLQIIKAAHYTIIDDAFNSNPAGAKAAIEVLGQMQGNQKILITPGMVELGAKEAELNRQMAAFAATVCDYIILVGKKHSLPLQEGLKQAAYTKFAVAADLNEARTILAEIVQKDDIVLFENDLPDTYNEA